MITILYRFSVLFSVAAACLLSQAAIAAEATMTIEQAGNAHLPGAWALHTPDGRILRNDPDTVLRTITPVAEGTYTLRIDPPQHARTTVLIYRDSDITRHVDTTTVRFTVEGGENVRIVIICRFLGSIAITSDPEGQSFTLTGAEGMEWTGTTPFSLHGLPPQEYTVQFNQRAGCRIPRQQQRILEPNGSIAFHGVYFCDYPNIADVPVAERPTATPPPPPSAILLPNQYEVLPGGTISYTLIVQNPGKTTARNTVVSVQFDPEQGAVTQMHDGGIIRANLMVWEVPPIYAGQQWSTAFMYRVHNDRMVGERIALTTRIHAEGLIERGVASEALTQSVGVTLLPETGAKHMLFLLALLHAAALTLAATIRLKQYVLVTTAEQ